jgi:inhibitor of cysteine peptidase
MAYIATVESVEAHAQSSDPNHIDVTIKGYVPNPCTKITQVGQQRSGNTFTITLTTVQEAGAACIQVISPFEQTVTLDVTGLAPGSYTVIVQNMSAKFDLK